MTMTETLVFHVDIQDKATIPELQQLRGAFINGPYQLSVNWDDRAIGVWRVEDDDPA